MVLFDLAAKVKSILVLEGEGLFRSGSLGPYSSSELRAVRWAEKLGHRLALRHSQAFYLH